MELRTKHPTLALTLLLCTLLFATAPQAAKLYKWKDAEGNTHYSQSPPEEGEAEEMRVKDKPAQQPEQEEQEEDGPPESAMRDAEAEEVRRRNCEIARQNLNVYQTSERIQQADGSILTLSDEMREAKIQEAEEKIEEFCR
ncbi:MAG: DUF4124 domain-containing protein [Pseudomonadota bacterium]